MPAMFTIALPGLSYLNIMGLHSAVLSARIFNALIIPALIPLALRGFVSGRPAPRRRSIETSCGLAAPFIGIKLIDFLLSGQI
jgi:K+-transporting ATPase ATPase B chain